MIGELRKYECGPSKVDGSSGIKARGHSRLTKCSFAWLPFFFLVGTRKVLLKYPPPLENLEMTYFAAPMERNASGSALLKADFKHNYYFLLKVSYSFLPVASSRVFPVNVMKSQTQAIT